MCLNILGKYIIDIFFSDVWYGERENAVVCGSVANSDHYSNYKLHFWG